MQPLLFGHVTTKITSAGQLSRAILLGYNRERVKLRAGFLASYRGRAHAQLSQCYVGARNRIFSNQTTNF